MVFMIPHFDKPLPLLNSDKLIKVRVDFQSDIPAGLYAHEGKL